MKHYSFFLWIITSSRSFRCSEPGQIFTWLSVHSQKGITLGGHKRSLRDWCSRKQTSSIPCSFDSERLNSPNFVIVKSHISAHDKSCHCSQLYLDIVTRRIICAFHEMYYLPSISVHTIIPSTQVYIMSTCIVVKIITIIRAPAKEVISLCCDCYLLAKKGTAGSISIPAVKRTSPGEYREQLQQLS